MSLPQDVHRARMATLAPAHRYDGSESFGTWQTRARAKLLDLLGLPLTLCDDRMTVEYERTLENFTEIRFQFQSEEGYFVPCHFLTPNGATGPLPVVICLQGHSKGMHISLARPKYPGDEESINGGDRDFAIRAVREGFCALTVEQRCFGECGGTEKGPDCNDASMTALLLGRTTIGERVWDVQRAIDVLEKHFPQADLSRIICMGNSGGGTTALFAGCVETRIRYCMPSCYFCAFEDSIGAMRHCACNYVPSLRLCFDAGDLAGLVAPRPMVVVAGREDPIFPFPGVEKAYAVAQRYYQAANAPDALRLVVGEGGHRFYADAAWPVMKALMEQA